MRGSNRRTAAFLAIAATQLMVILDGTVVTVALHAIRRGLGFDDAGLPWVVDGFFLAFALTLLPAGRLGDRIGARTVFLAGTAIFTLASVWCGLAWDPASLVAARVGQGFGGGLATAVALGMVAQLFPEPPLRIRAFAVLAFVGSVGASVGLLAGGVLTELASWRWVFLVNVPIGVVVLAVALRALEPTPGVVGGGGLLPRRLFADRRFAVANAVLFTMVMAGQSFQYLTSLYLQETLGLSPLATGAGFLTTSIAIAVASLGLSGRLASRYGAERVLIGGLVFFVLGMLLMVRLPDEGSYWADVAIPLASMGLGFGLAMPQVTSIAMSAAPPEYGGVASGFVNTTQQAGGAVGLFAVVSVAVATERAYGYLAAALALGVAIALATYLHRSARAVPSSLPREDLAGDAVSCRSC